MSFCQCYRRNSDERLRDSQRRMAQGDLEAAAKFLIERFRSGEISLFQLEKAAQLGHPAARLVRPEILEIDWSNVRARRKIFWELLKAEMRPLVVQASIAFVERAMPFMKRGYPSWTQLHDNDLTNIRHTLSQPGETAAAFASYGHFGFTPEGIPGMTPEEIDDLYRWQAQHLAELLLATRS